MSPNKTADARFSIPLSEVVDRISILRLKVRRLADQRKQQAALWLEALEEQWQAAGQLPPDELPGFARLCRIHEQLWEVEDRLRKAETERRFGQEFIQNARAVYQLNDQRAAIKQAFDHHLASTLTDPKDWCLPTVGLE